MDFWVIVLAVVVGNIATALARVLLDIVLERLTADKARKAEEAKQEAAYWEARADRL